MTSENLSTSILLELVLSSLYDVYKLIEVYINTLVGKETVISLILLYQHIHLLGGVEGLFHSLVM